ncbi:MAG: hypothetical protein WC668_02065 [Patescibacteria group bacterium]|jgi:hypothetical protein
MRTVSKTGNKKVRTGTISAITGAIICQGGKAKDLTAIVRNDELLKQLATTIIELSKKIIQVIVDCTMSLGDMIDAGKYDWVNSNINANNFPISRKGKKVVSIELWHPNRYFNNGDEVIAELKKTKPGYRFTQIEELLALGAVRPDLQRQFPIAALGSIWHPAGDRDFAFLDRHDAERNLFLDYLERDFSDRWRFAVVREHACR